MTADSRAKNVGEELEGRNFPEVVDWRGSRGNADHQRLRAALLDAHRRLTFSSNEAELQGSVDGCERCLRLAVSEARADRHYVAWDLLHQFDIEYVARMDKNQRRAEARDLSAEVREKLTGWRAKATDDLLKLIEADADPPVSVLVHLRRHLAAQSQNAWLKRTVLKQRIRLTLGLSLLTITFFLISASYGLYDTLIPSLAMPLRLGIIAASLGGVISVATSTESTEIEKTKRPQLLDRFISILLRPTIAALCAIPVVFLVQSGLLKIAESPPLWTTVSLCLLTGYSAKWLPDQISKLAEKVK